MLSHAEQDLIRRDIALPGLATLLDAAVFRAALQASADAQIRAVRLDYLRYKPGQNCIAAYTLTVAGAEVECHAKAYRQCDGAKLEKAKLRPAISGALGSGRFIWPQTRIEVCVFPNDNKLGSLALMGDAARREDFLRRHLFGHEQLWQSEVCTLAYKPERRWVGALEVDGTPLAVCKFYGESAFESARLKSKCFRNGEVLRLAPLIGRSKGRGALFYDWQRGELLSQAMLGPTFDSAVMFRVGVALAELQRQPTTNLSLRSGDAAAREIVSLGEFLEFLLPAEAERVHDIAARLAASIGGLPQGDSVVHGDFYAKQILFSGGEITVLDLDEAARGDAADDLGTFLAHLEREVAVGRLNASHLVTFRSQLLAGFASQAGDVDSKLVELYTAARLFGRLPQFFRNHDPEWSQRTRESLERVAALLGGSCLNEISRPETRQRSAAVSQTSRSKSECAAAGFQHSRAPYKGESGTPTGLTTGFDAKLPALEIALAPKVVEPKLASTLMETYPDIETLTLQSATLWCHKPGRRGLARPTTAVTLLGKLYRRGVDVENVAAVRELIKSGFGGDSADGISIPDFVGALPEMGMTLQRRESGRPLAESLTGTDGQSAARRAADAICKLHRSSVLLRKTHTVADELEILDARLTALAGRRPEWELRLRGLWRECRKMAGRLHIVTPRSIHRDFYHDQLLLDDRRVWLLDLDLLCAGDPALDAGNFIGHLIEWGVRAPEHRAAFDAAAAAFTERFIEHGGTDTTGAVEIYTTLTLARHVSLSAQFPERAAFTERILAVCEERCGSLYETFRPTELVGSDL